jgi:molybdenum cofactor biosynthesis protein B
MSTHEHKAASPKTVTVAVLTASTTRTLQTDVSGQWIHRQAREAGHEIVAHLVVPDDADRIADAVRTVIRDNAPGVLLLNGGTGISPKDLTIEAVRPLFAKELSAFGVLFAALSYEEIGSAALLSRATAGVIGQTVVFCMPGSLKACQLACSKLIFPEIGHLVHHIQE